MSVAISRVDEVKSDNGDMERELTSSSNEKDEPEQALGCPQQGKKAAEGSDEEDLTSPQEVQGEEQSVTAQQKSGNEEDAKEEEDPVADADGAGLLEDAGSGE